MSKPGLKTKTGADRLATLKVKNTSIVSCDFSSCSRDEGASLLAALVALLNDAEEDSVRIFFDVSDTVHDSRQTNDWKRHLPLFNSRIRKSAVIGLSPMTRMGMIGIRMYAKLMGQEKATLQTRYFETREEAFDYLAQ